MVHVLKVEKTMEKTIAYFRYSSICLHRDESDDVIVGRGENLEKARDNLVSQITERVLQIIDKQEHQLVVQVMTEHGFYTNPFYLPTTPPKQDGWDDWCLVIFEAYYDDSTSREIRGYLYVPKNSIIEKRLIHGRVEKIKVCAENFMKVCYHIDDCSSYELPNASFLWKGSKWTSTLTFGG